MPDSSSSSSQLGYSKRDASSERLWLTQRPKANPWEHRGTRTEADETAKEPEAAPAAEAAAEDDPTMIGQVDTLRLQAMPGRPGFNPFEQLIERTLGLDLSPETPPAS